jgi:hypothetical protein
MIARADRRRSRVAPRTGDSRTTPKKGSPKHTFFERLAYSLGCSVEAAKRAWELRLL